MNTAGTLYVAQFMHWREHLPHAKLLRKLGDCTSLSVQHEYLLINNSIGMVRVRVRMCMRVLVRVRVCVHMCMRVLVRVRVYVRVRVRVSACVCVHVRVYVHALWLCMHYTCS